jgi:hypothetical protein
MAQIGLPHGGHAWAYWAVTTEREQRSPLPAAPGQLVRQELVAVVGLGDHVHDYARGIFRPEG